MCFFFIGNGVSICLSLSPNIIPKTEKIDVKNTIAFAIIVIAEKYPSVLSEAAKTSYIALITIPYGRKIHTQITQRIKAAAKEEIL